MESLSVNQRGLWFIDQVSNDRIAYIEGGALRIHGHLDIPALGRALDAVVAKHFCLQCCVVHDGKSPRAQTRQRSASFRVVEAYDGSRETLAEISREFARPFELSDGPLADFVLFRLAELSHVLLLKFHHSVYDGWSNQLVLRDLEEFYRRASSALPVTVPARDERYLDFVREESERIVSSDSLDSLAYFESALADLKETTLPLDHKRPAVKGERGRSIRLGVSRDVLLRLREQDLTARFAANTIFAAAYQILLWRHCNQTDIVYGSPFANRTSRYYDVVGYFANMVPLRNTLDPEEKLSSLLSRVRDLYAGAHEHQWLPFPLLVNELSERRALSQNSVFQNVFAFQNVHTHTFELEGLSIEPVKLEKRASKFDSECYVWWDGDGRAEVEWVFDEQTFDAETVVAYSEHFNNILREISEGVDVRLKDLRLFSSLELAEFRAWNDTYEPGQQESSLVRRFVETAQRSPDLPALYFRDEVVSYADLDRKSSQYAQVFRACAGERFLVLVERSPELIYTLFGVHKGRGSYVPIDPAYPDDKIGRIVTELEIRRFVVSAAMLPRLREIYASLGLNDGIVFVPDGTGAVDFGAAALVLAADFAAAPTTNLTVEPQPDDEAYVIFTSGSTGTPKGVSVSNSAVSNLIAWVNQRYRVCAGDKLLFITSIAFDLSVYDIFGILASGASLRIASETEVRDPERLLTYLREDGITFWDSAPASLQNLSLLLESAEVASSTLRLVFLSGDWVPISLPGTLADPFPNARIVALGGATEAAIWSNYFDVNAVEPEWDSIPYGRPIQNARYYVLDDSLNLAPVGTAGDLYIAGDCLANGYANDPTLTAKKFIPHSIEFGAKLYRTGDRARRRRDGVLIFLGREDDQVKIRGYRVELGEVRAALNAVPGIKDSVLVVDERDRHMKSLHAFVVFQTGLSSSEADVRRALASTLPEYMIPSTVEALNALPETANGKVDYRALKGRIERVDLQPIGQEGSSEFEQAVHDVFRSHLRNKSFGVDANFFSIGGNSVLGFRVLRSIAERFQRAVPMTLLFEAQSIRDFARALEQLPCSASRDAVERSDELLEGADCSLSDLQQAYWIGASGAYFNPMVAHLLLVFRLDDFVAPQFEAAVRAVVAMHEALQCTVSAAGAVAFAQSVAFELRSTACSSQAEFESHSAEREEYHRMHGPRYDRAPMLEVEALTFGSTARVYFNINLVVCDGMSVNILCEQIFQRYRGDSAVTPANSQFGYTRYLRALAARKASAEYAGAAAYWKAKLSEVPLGPRLPVPVGQNASTHARPLTRFSHVVQRPHWQSIKLACARAGISPDAAILTLFAETLGRWSENAAFSLIVMFFDRTTTAGHDLVGNFATTTLASFATGEPSPAREVMKRTRDDLFRNLEHSSFSGVEVLQELSKLHKSNVLIPFSFASGLNLFGEEGVPPAWESAVERVHLQVPQIALDHQIYENRLGELVVVWDVLLDYFRPHVIGAIFETYAGLLEKMAEADWDRPIRLELPIEQRLRRHRVNETTAELPTRLLHDGFSVAARRLPTNDALVGDGVHLTYAELDKLSNCFANALRSAGVARAPARVAFCFERKWQQVVAALGILKLGCAYVPLSAALPDSRIAQIIEDGEVALLACDRERGTKRELVLSTLERLPEYADSALVEARPLSPEDSAYVIYTSGSTGTPKGVDIAHGAVMNTIDDINRMLAVDEQDAAVLLSSIGFDLSVYDIFGLLGVGGKVVLPDTGRELDPEHVLEIVAKYGVTIWNSVPEYMKIATEHALNSDLPRRAGHLKHVLLSGDWIPLDLPAKVRAAFAPQSIHSLGGATEASIWSIHYRIDAVDDAWRSIPYGTPLTNQYFRIYNERMLPCPDWVAGDLYIGGRGLAKGYLNDPQRTAASFVPDPETDGRLYKTGDRGLYLPDGSIELLGRLDSQVKIQGYRIELGDIEAALTTHHGVQRAIVIDDGDKFVGKQLIAFIVGRVERAELERHLSERLPKYMIPRRFIFIDELPLSGNGKVDRGQLRRGLRADLDAERIAIVPPHTPLQNRLFTVFRDVLGHDRFGIHDSFLDVGGTSFLAIRALARVRAFGGQAVSLPQFLAHPSIADLERVLAGEASEQEQHQDLIWFARNELPTLVLFHPIGGSAFGYRRLANELRDSFNVVGVNHPGLSDAAVDHFDSIESLARFYAERLEGLLAGRAFSLGGWSMGGLIAHAVAAELAGRLEPDAVFMIDSYIYRSLLDRKPAREHDLFVNFLFDFVASNGGPERAEALRAYADADTSLEDIYQKLQRQKLVPEEVEWEHMKRFFQVYRDNTHALYSFAGQLMKVPTLLLVARDDIRGHFAASVARLEAVTPSLTVQEVSGTHYSVVAQHSSAVRDSLTSFDASSSNSFRDGSRRSSGVVPAAERSTAGDLRRAKIADTIRTGTEQ